MRHPQRDGRCRALTALILVAAFCPSPPAFAEIFKCVAKDRTPLYQNFPCQFDSIGGMPSNLRDAKTTWTADASSTKSKAPSVDVASNTNPADAKEARVGMTPDEVRALLGEPLEIVQDQPVEGVETWRYVDKTIQLDRTHRVVDVQTW